MRSSSNVQWCVQSSWKTRSMYVSVKSRKLSYSLCPLFQTSDLRQVKELEVIRQSLAKRHITQWSCHRHMHVQVHRHTQRNKFPRISIHEAQLWEGGVETPITRQCIRQGLAVCFSFQSVSTYIFQSQKQNEIGAINRRVCTSVCLWVRCCRWPTTCLFLFNLVYMAHFPDNQVIPGKDCTLHFWISWMIEARFWLTVSRGTFCLYKAFSIILVL